MRELSAEFANKSDLEVAKLLYEALLENPRRKVAEEPLCAAILNSRACDMQGHQGCIRWARICRSVISAYEANRPICDNDLSKLNLHDEKLIIAVIAGCKAALLGTELPKTITITVDSPICRQGKEYVCEIDGCKVSSYEVDAETTSVAGFDIVNPYLLLEGVVNGLLKDTTSLNNLAAPNDNPKPLRLETKHLEQGRDDVASWRLEAERLEELREYHRHHLPEFYLQNAHDAIAILPKGERRNEMLSLYDYYAPLVFQKIGNHQRAVEARERAATRKRIGSDK